MGIFPSSSSASHCLTPARASPGFHNLVLVERIFSPAQLSPGVSINLTEKESCNSQQAFGRHCKSSRDPTNNPRFIIHHAAFHAPGAGQSCDSSLAWLQKPRFHFQPRLFVVFPAAVVQGKESGEHAPYPCSHRGRPLEQGLFGRHPTALLPAPATLLQAASVGSQD